MAHTPLLLTRSADAGREPLDEYVRRGGYEALRNADDAVLARVESADLRGRGGAGFSTAKKWALARATEGDAKYVVANGGEHEPGSQKDRYLVAHYPHAVLEGMALAAKVTGARVGYLYLIDDMRDAIDAARAAIAEAEGAGLLGRDGLEVRIHTGPPTYVAGEETAALEVIEGRKAWPRKKPPYPGVAGLFGKPTTVNNVETFAFVPSIVRDGGRAWRSAGVRGAQGAMLFTLDASVNRPGVYECAIGTTFRELLDEQGGGTRSGRGVRAVLPALSSAFVADLDVPATVDAVRAAGSNLGCGGVSFVEEDGCVVERVHEIAQFFMREQCGQCPPCRMETNTLAAVLKQVQGGTTNDYRAQIEKITAFARGKGFCSLIEMAAAPVLSALRLFPADFEAHARTGRCAG